MIMNGTPQGAGETVLVVDDETVTRTMVRQILEGSGYRVVEGDDGESALDVFSRSSPHIVLMDVRMPTMDGFEACRRLRAIPGGEHVPILMLTSLDDVVSVRIAFDSGATDFITKPINWELLAERIRYALRSRARDVQLRESEQRLAHAQHLARLGRWRYDFDARRIELSGTLSRELGFGDADGGISLADMVRRVQPGERRVLMDRLREVFRSTRSGEVEVQLLGSGGRIFTLHLWVERTERDGQPALEGTVQDVTERIAAEARASYHAHYDRLTDLPNRVLFWDRLSQAIGEARRNRSCFAVILIDLDRFAGLNASLGHANGDRVLKILANRLGDAIRSSETLSRIAGDEFAVIQWGPEDEAAPGQQLTRLLDSFNEPIRAGETEVNVSASIGIAFYPGDGGDVDTLLSHADAARAHAKRRPGVTYQFYTPAMGGDVRDRLATERALRRGIADEAFVVHYQPLVSLADGAVWGVEVLLRWEHPELGTVMPDEFIPVLEESGLLEVVGDWTIRRACEEMRDRDFMVSVNLSPVQFSRPDLVDRVLGIVEETGFPARHLQLEITENVLIDDPEAAAETVGRLRDAGVKIAIDDFGTGFSSLSYLKLYDTDVLKIDRSFITELEGVPANQAIVRSTITLGHDLGMQIIGEGVEGEGALEMLRRMGCDVAQGYLIARPVAERELSAWLAER